MVFFIINPYSYEIGIKTKQNLDEKTSSRHQNLRFLHSRFEVKN